MPPGSLTFRVATFADAPAVVALVQSAYRGEGARGGWTTESDLLGGQRTDLDEVLGLIAREGSVVLLAEREGGLAGCCHVERVDGGECYFGLFAVPPAGQRGGVGRALLAEAERVAREDWGCGAMTMTVLDVRVELLEWYERRGYRRTGEHRPFPYGNERYGVPKREDLRFEVLTRRLTPR